MKLYCLFFIILFSLPAFYDCLNWVECPVFSEYTNTPSNDIRVQNGLSGKKSAKTLSEKLSKISQKLLPFRLPAYNRQKERKQTDLQAQCTLVALPLYYGDSVSEYSSEKINIFVKRVLFNPTQPSDKIVIRVEGGPGPSAEGLESIFENNNHHKVFPEHDVYIVDHRGTGRSNFIGCTNEDDTISCAEQVLEKYGGKAFDTFSTTGFARDLELIMSIIEHEEGKKQITLYGVSYGTLIASRFATLFPNRLESIIIDGVVSPRITFGSSFSQTHHDTLLKSLEWFCGADEFCSAGLNCTVVEYFSKTMDSIKTGSNTCLNRVSDVLGMTVGYDDLRQVFLIFTQATFFRSYLPLFANFLWECADLHVERISEFLGWLLGAFESPDPNEFQSYKNFYDLPIEYTNSDILYMNIVSSELIRPTETIEEYYESVENLYAYTDASGILLTANNWPRLYRDSEDSMFQKPTNGAYDLLILNGNLDAQTPDFSAQYAYDEFFTASRASKSLQMFKYAGHGIVYDSSSIYNEDGGNCGFDLVENWYTTGTNECSFDNTCMNTIFGDVQAEYWGSITPHFSECSLNSDLPSSDSECAQTVKPTRELQPLTYTDYEVNFPTTTVIPKGPRILTNGWIVDVVSFTEKDESIAQGEEYIYRVLGSCEQTNNKLFYNKRECKRYRSQYWDMYPTFTDSDCTVQAPQIYDTVFGPIPIWDKSDSKHGFVKKTTCTGSSLVPGRFGHGNRLVFTVYENSDCQGKPVAAFVADANGSCVPNGRTYASEGISGGYTQSCTVSSDGSIHNPYVNFADGFCTQYLSEENDKFFTGGCQKWDDHSGTDIVNDNWYFQASCANDGNNSKKSLVEDFDFEF